MEIKLDGDALIYLISNGYMTINEARHLMGLEPIDNGRAANKKENRL
jgi:hypothetical protein